MHRADSTQSYSNAEAALSQPLWVVLGRARKSCAVPVHQHPPAHLQNQQQAGMDLLASFARQLAVSLEFYCIKMAVRAVSVPTLAELHYFDN